MIKVPFDMGSRVRTKGSELVRRFSGGSINVDAGPRGKMSLGRPAVGHMKQPPLLSLCMTILRVPLGHMPC